MSIVKMKHLRALGMQEGRGKLLRRLRSLGCVEIDTPKSLPPEWDFLTPPDADELAHHLGEADELSAALELLKPYAKEKGGLLTPRPQVAEETLFDEERYASALSAARAVNEAQAALNGQKARRGKLETQLHALEPWLELPVPLDLAGTAKTDVMFVSASIRLPRAAIQERLDMATELYHLTWAGSDQEFQYFLVIAHKSAVQEVQAALLDLGCARLNLCNWSGTAAENHRALLGQLEALDKETEELQKTFADNAERVFDLKVAQDKANQEVELERAKGRLLDTQYTFFLDGWFPAEKESEVKATLEEFGLAYDIADPTEEEYPQVPIKLKNGPLSSPMNMVTEMYSLPAYGGIDPNPLMMPFFVLFYGIMMADMAYGIIMMLASVVYLKKARPPEGSTMRHMMSLMGLCGVTTFILGAMTGGFFGDFIPQLLKLIDPASTFELPYLFTPLNNTLEILIGSLALGFVQEITGMAISFVKKTKDGHFLDALLDEGAWWVIFAGVACAILGVGSVNGVPVVLCVGGVMLVAGCLKKNPSIAVLGTLVGAIYNGVTGVFQDVLSYSRLMALMLSGSIIASVFNTLGTVTGNVVTFILISMFGNALNFVLNILGCFVHDLRLQCLEFFGKFYEDGGRPFKPLQVKPKNVEIKKS